MGAHRRRINPRGQPVTGQGQPGGSNNTHRLIRRGLPYGPAYDPTQPYGGIERGLLGYFINSSIENQYEFVLGHWVNDSEFAWSVGLPPKSKDPMIGTRDPAESIFVIPQASGSPPIKITGFSSFVTTKAAAYCFLPSITAVRTLALVQLQAYQTIKPCQQLRYWSTVPFRHGPIDVVKHSATPPPDNPAHPLQRNKPNALQDELIRHLQGNSKMSSFDFGIQFLNAGRMTYWGKRRDANFWIENASVEWDEAEAPFHTVARLTLLPKSQLGLDAGAATYFDVTGHSTPDTFPSGALIAPAGLRRLPAEKHARAGSGCDPG
ncbi:MAG TPA: hypothetical protein VI455_09335 [Terriglobia bacterium]